MYILFAILVSLVLYGPLVAALRLVRQNPDGFGRTALGSFLVLAATLVIFNFTSRAVGVDLGPGHPVSYNIPEDYLARGFVGLLALVPYALACLSPAVALAVLRGRQRAS